MIEIPSTFCLTKVGRYSGQEAPQILRRKELERQAGNGVFWWGVGESKCCSIDHLRKRTTPPKVFFVWQRRHAKQPKAARLLFGCHSRERVAAKMTPAQFAEARRLAREWQPKRSGR